MMTKVANPIARALRLGLLLAGLIARPVLGTLITQTVPLNYGWNAVWLEVSPEEDEEGKPKWVQDVFKPTSTNVVVDIIATQKRQAGTEEFVTDPTELYRNQPGWLIWKNDFDTPDAIRAESHRAYLVHVKDSDGIQPDGTPAEQLAIRGRVTFWDPQWNPGGYNLVGFSVTNSPTFTDLLSASGINSTNSQIQELVSTNGTWKNVDLKDAIEAGRAYWTEVPFALRSLAYYGPVRAAFSGSQLGSLAFGGAGSLVDVPYQVGNSSDLLHLSPAEITFTSLESTNGPSHAVTLSLVATDPRSADPQELRLFPLERVPDQLAWRVKTNASSNVAEPIGANWSVRTLKPQESITLTLGLDRNWTSNGNYREYLYRIDVALQGGGTYYQYLPVSARNDDLAPQDPSTDNTISPDPSLAGLWLGSVAVNAVTSLTEDAYPLKPASTAAPLRLLLHVGINGTATLLANVTRMQTKTADPSVPPQEVLILDEAQIPFYEGIQERGGKKVGIRYETAFFDMPRLYRTDGQSISFLQRVADTNNVSNVEELTDQMVQGFLAAQHERPPDLQESYALQFPLVGEFLPGQSVGTTNNAPLRLDAFHRSNPFRHAYHPQHGAGYSIERTLTVELDGDYRPGSGLLTGTYYELTAGLATQPIESRGRITLQRVSTVTSLQ